uniref:Uncharacterized protein n=1 Tax=Triticum urartu TaxID=4572 RepID=A0A8R7TS58_TRIUA
SPNPDEPAAAPGARGHTGSAETHPAGCCGTWLTPPPLTSVSPLRRRPLLRAGLGAQGIRDRVCMSSPVSI